jgi:hypothetical protein
MVSFGAKYRQLEEREIRGLHRIDIEDSGVLEHQAVSG